MAVGVEFGLLGPLVIRCDGTTMPVAKGRQGALLAALLLDADHAVTVPRLTEVLWGDTPPAAARAALHNQVRRLRDALGEVGRDRIRTQPGGYLIHLEPGELDVPRMQDLLTSALTAARAGAWDQASATAAGAVLLWRGEPLADLDSEVLARKVPYLTEIYLQAVEVRLEAEVNLGRYSEAVSELRRFTADHPFREHAHALLMSALYRSGSRGEALTAYQAIRQTLVNELGCEPGAELRDMHQQILKSDQVAVVPEVAVPEIAVPEVAGPVLTPAAAARFPDRVVPRELPGAIGDFTGRARELRALTEMLDSTGKDSAGTMVISAIGGTAGIGKSALAVQWAHQVADRFPDGQLYVNLRGFHPSGKPMPSARAVRGFLDVLGIPAERIPATPEAQSGLYRSLLSQRRMLVVLDNARDEEQVRPLLPGSPGCPVLVTSRSQLSGLVAAEGARTLALDLLTEAEARELLARRLGAARLDAEPEAAAELIALCAGLPLALAITAARADIPGLRLGVLTEELKDAQLRLDALETGDPAVSARAVFSWSVDSLPASQIRMFRLLGLHPGPDVTIPAAASLAGIPSVQAHRELRNLAGACLISEHVPGRYAMHDLLRAYAAEQADAFESEAGRRAATLRMLDHYLYTARAADRQLRPGRDPIALDPLQPGTVPEEVADGSRASAWFQAEQHVMPAVAQFAHAAGFSGHAWKIPWTLTVFLDCRGDWPLMVTMQERALVAASGADDKSGQAMVHRDLARALLRLGRIEDGYDHLEQALSLYQQTGDLTGQGRTHLALALALDAEDRYDLAFSHNEQALRLLSRTGDQAGHGNALSSIGWSHAQRGEYAKALACCHQAIRLQLSSDNQYGGAHTLDSLGYVHRRLRQHARAIDCYEQSVSLFGQLGDRYYQASALTNLGDTLHDAGDQHGARDAWQRALDIFDGLHHPRTDRVRAKLSALARGD